MVTKEKVLESVKESFLTTHAIYKLCGGNYYVVFSRLNDLLEDKKVIREKLGTYTVWKLNLEDSDE